MFICVSSRDCSATIEDIERGGSGIVRRFFDDRKENSVSVQQIERACACDHVHEFGVLIFNAVISVLFHS